MTSAALGKAIRRYWYVLVIGLALSAGITWLVTPANIGATPVAVTNYTATATLLVDYGSGDQGQSVPMARVVLYVTSGDVPAKAAERLGYTGAPAVLASSMEVTGDPVAGALTIASTASTAEEAEARANTFAEEAIAFFEASAAPGMPKLTLLQPATAIPNVSKNTVVLPPSRWVRAALGGAVGLVLAFALALVLSHFDSRLRTREEIHRAMRLPVVGEVPKLPRASRSRKEIVVVSDPLSPYADSFRAVRAAITHRQNGAEDEMLPRRSVDHVGTGHQARVVLVTSGHADDGKTTSVANLAASFAESGLSVLVLDADVRKPDLHELFDVPQGSGISDFVTSHGQASISGLIRPTKVPGVRLITAGSRLEHPETLPARFGPLFDEVREHADIVLVDAAPILAANDVFDLLPLVDTVLLVVRSGRLTENASSRIAELLGRFQVAVTGVVLVAPPQRRGSSYGYGYTASTTARRAAGLTPPPDARAAGSAASPEPPTPTSPAHDSLRQAPEGADRPGRMVVEQEAEDQSGTEQDVLDGLEVITGRWGVPPPRAERHDP